MARKRKPGLPRQCKDASKHGQDAIHTVATPLRMTPQQTWSPAVTSSWHSQAAFTPRQWSPTCTSGGDLLEHELPPVPPAPLFDAVEDPPPPPSPLPCHLFPGEPHVSAARVSSRDASIGQDAVPLAHEEPDACMTDDKTDDTAEQYVVPLHSPMDLAPPVRLQLAITATEPPPPSEQWIRTCVELPGMARGLVPDPLRMHNTMLYSMQLAQAMPQPCGAIGGHGRASREQT